MFNSTKTAPLGILCFIYGSVTTLAFAPYNHSYIAIISPALLFFTWLNTDPKKAFLFGYLFGFGLFGIGVNWLHISINLFGGLNLLGSLLITFLLVAFLALYPACVGYLGKRYFFTSKLVFVLVTAPGLWVITEWGRTWIFTGFPWLQLGYSQTDTLIGGLAPVVGTYGVTWATLLCAGLLVALFYTDTQKKLIIILFAGILYMGCWLVNNESWTDKSERYLSVALIQGGIPQELKWQPEYRQRSFDLYLNLSAPYLGFDLIIWPETAIPAFYHQATDYLKQLAKLARENGTNFLVGIPFSEQDSIKYYNSAVMLHDDVSIYHKRHLVPFGEYLPLDVLTRPILNVLGIPMSDFSPGDQDIPILNGLNLNAGISICYEDTFGEEVIQAIPGADVLVNISNDAWFGDSIAPHQHLQMARMRALETGRYMLRATNTGISAVIDEKGKIIRQSEQFVPASISAEVPVFRGTTPYARFGNIPVIVTTFLLLIALYSRQFIAKKPD